MIYATEELPNEAVNNSPQIRKEILSALLLKGAFFSMPLDGTILSTTESLSFSSLPDWGVLVAFTRHRFNAQQSQIKQLMLYSPNVRKQ